MRMNECLTVGSRQGGADALFRRFEEA